MNINDLDLEAARKQVTVDLGVSASESDVKRIIYEATGGKELQVVEPVTDWDGVEALRINHRVKMVDGINVIRLMPDSEGFYIVENNKGGYDLAELIPHDSCHPIPQVKKIDHSSLVGSGIDVILKNGQLIPENPSITESCIQSIRMNHWMLLTDEQIRQLPHGYTYEFRTIPDGYETPSEQLVKAVGILKGWEL